MLGCAVCPPACRKRMMGLGCAVWIHPCSRHIVFAGACCQPSACIVRSIRAGVCCVPPGPHSVLSGLYMDEAHYLAMVSSLACYMQQTRDAFGCALWRIAYRDAASLLGCASLHPTCNQHRLCMRDARDVWPPACSRSMVCAEMCRPAC